MSTSHTERGGAAMAAAVEELYRHGQTDYGLEPIVATDATGAPVGRIAPDDAVVFCCRRGEREIQLTDAFVAPQWDRFPRRALGDLMFVILTLYHDRFKDLPVAFAPARVSATLAETISRAGLKQLHVAESEKFAHVTFFLNGGQPDPFAGEEDVRIPSPHGIPFDQVPELSLAAVTDQVLLGIGKGYNAIVTNFANGDVIGHTANNVAKVECAQFVDTHLDRVIDAARAAGYVVFVTADHGNLEEMTNADGTPNVAHTTNRVPFLAVTGARSGLTLREGTLADVAPTVLQALGIVPPPAMTGSSLLAAGEWGSSHRVVLIILDGWGLGRADESNPIHLAATPVWDRLTRTYPCAQLQASGEAVGLQPGKAGNSEAGHMNIGAGRVVQQDDVRLDRAMQDGSFYTNDVLCRAIEAARTRGTHLHLIGLLTDKSSHGSIDYPLALLRMARDRGLEQVYVHVLFDGRSTEPGSAPDRLMRLAAQMDEIGIGQIVTGIGRGIALDRDGNFGKTQRAYDALVFGKGHPACLAG